MQAVSSFCFHKNSQNRKFNNKESVWQICEKKFLETSKYFRVRPMPVTISSEFNCLHHLRNKA